MAQESSGEDRGELLSPRLSDSPLDPLDISRIDDDENRLELLDHHSPRIVQRSYQQGWKKQSAEKNEETRATLNNASREASAGTRRRDCRRGLGGARRDPRAGGGGVVWCGVASRRLVSRRVDVVE